VKRATTCTVCPPPADSKGGRHWKAPAWAIAVASLECKRKKLTLIWRVASGWRSAHYVSGLANDGGKAYNDGWRWQYIPGAVVTINAGKSTCERYQLHVLLHEIAHINVGCHEDHGPVFCRESVRLHIKYGLLEEALDKGWLYSYAGERKAMERARARRAKRAA
jgi:hypothetical protein